MWLVVVLVSAVVRIWGVGGFTRWYLFWLHLSSVTVCARVKLLQFFNHCIKNLFLVCISCSVRVGVTEICLILILF